MRRMRRTRRDWLCARGGAPVLAVELAACTPGGDTAANSGPAGEPTVKMRRSPERSNRSGLGNR